MARIETLKQRGSAPAKNTSIFPFISILPVAWKTCDCPQHLHAKKSTFFFFLPPQKNKLQQLSALFIWRRVRRMYEAIFIKAGVFLDTPTSTQPLFSLVNSSCGVDKAGFQRLREENGDLWLRRLPERLSRPCDVTSTQPQIVFLHFFLFC